MESLVALCLPMVTMMPNQLHSVVQLERLATPQRGSPAKFTIMIFLSMRKSTLTGDKEGLSLRSKLELTAVISEKRGTVSTLSLGRN